MKKLLLCLPVLALLLLCACGEKAASGAPAVKEELPVPEALAAELQAAGAFSEELVLTENDVGCFLYGLVESDAPEMRYYFSSGAVADEIAILPCADDAALEKVKSECATRLDLQTQLFTEYKPEEVPKLEKALVLQRENTVVLCVATDYEKAQAVLDRYF
jgi:hypothetical protein